MKRAIACVLVSTAVIAGCGGGSKQSSSDRSSSPMTTSGVQNPTGVLQQAVRAAIRSNAELSNWVLWHNAIPSWAGQSTRGAALDALRASAAARRRQHLQMLGVSPHFEILSITLDPSYTVATAVVRERGEVRPYRDGRQLGQPIKVNDVARLELRRTGSATHFVVWGVKAAR